MSDALIIDVDTTAVVTAFDTVADAMHANLKAAAKITADNIATEARARVRRRTGQTGEKITVEETRSGDGYVVYVGDPRTQVGRYLEFGTKFMDAHPFLFASARIEETAHQNRARDAVQNAIDETGLGS